MRWSGSKVRCGNHVERGPGRADSATVDGDLWLESSTVAARTDAEAAMVDTLRVSVNELARVDDLRL
jgi:hypothetical protein